MRKRRVGNLMKVLLICMAFAAFFGVQAVFAADATKQEQTAAGSGDVGSG